jgi:histidinol-phosphatase
MSAKKRVMLSVTGRMREMTVTDPALLAEAVEMTRAAGELTLRWFQRRDLGVERKGDGTPVTEADRQAERLLRAEISRRHPDDAILGEEEEPKAGTSGRTWIIDPIDGTKAFTRGVPLYSNLLAVDDGEGPAVGVINLPALGETVYAGRGLGCFANDDRVTVSDKATLAHAYVSSSSFGHWDLDVFSRFRRAGTDLRTWGDGYGYALVATGRIDVMIDPAAAHWDLAPMPVILGEAGGRFSTWDGSADPAGGSGVATNGHLHDEVLSLLQGP